MFGSVSQTFLGCEYRVLGRCTRHVHLQASNVAGAVPHRHIASLISNHGRAFGHSLQAVSAPACLWTAEYSSQAGLSVYANTVYILQCQIAYAKRGEVTVLSPVGFGLLSV